MAKQQRTVKQQKRRGQTSKEGRRTDDIQTAARVLSDAVRTLSEAAVTGAADRLLFPHGIDVIHVTVDPDDGRVEVKVTGPPSAGRGATDSVAGMTAALSALTDDLTIGQKVPNQSEKATVGAATSAIKRATPEFQALVRNDNPDIVFKDEDLPVVGADHMMTAKLQQKADALATLVKNEWAGVKLRITEAWDENNEHGTKSVHYEARAVDITTSPVDGSKLGRLGRLAVNAGFDWVFFEDALHVHASMSK